MKDFNLCSLIVCIVFAFLGCSEQETMEAKECDRLASSPDDPNRNEPGIDFESLDVSKAVAICEKAVALASNPRLEYQFARSLQKAERNAEAAKWYGKAAEQGYAIAQYALAVMYANGLGIDKDKSRATDWYKKAAESGLELADKDRALVNKYPKEFDGDGEPMRSKAQAVVGLTQKQSDLDHEALKSTASDVLIENTTGLNKASEIRDRRLGGMRENTRIFDEQRTANPESQKNVCKEIIELTKATGIHDLSIENDCAAILAREDVTNSKVVETTLGALAEKQAVEQKTAKEAAAQKQAEADLEANIRDKLLSADISGLTLSMSFSQAEAAVRHNMEVARVRATESGKSSYAYFRDMTQFENADGSERIMLFRAKPDSDKLVGIGRWLNLPEGTTINDVKGQLTGKYGEPTNSFYDTELTWYGFEDEYVCRSHIGWARPPSIIEGEAPSKYEQYGSFNVSRSSVVSGKSKIDALKELKDKCSTQLFAMVKMSKLLVVLVDVSAYASENVSEDEPGDVILNL